MTILEAAGKQLAAECHAGRCPLLTGAPPIPRPENCPVGDAPCESATPDIWIESFQRTQKQDKVVPANKSGQPRRRSGRLWNRRLLERVIWRAKHSQSK